MPTDKQFTSQIRLNEGYVGTLYDYVARAYDPMLGRFISPDTIVPGAGNSQAFNRYMYVRGNPLKYTDPTGHAEISDPYESCGGGCLGGSTYGGGGGNSAGAAGAGGSSDDGGGGGGNGGNGSAFSWSGIETGACGVSYGCSVANAPRPTPSASDCCLGKIGKGCPTSGERKLLTAFVLLMDTNALRTTLGQAIAKDSLLILLLESPHPIARGAIMAELASMSVLYASSSDKLDIGYSGASLFATAVLDIDSGSNSISIGPGHEFVITVGQDSIVSSFLFAAGLIPEPNVDTAVNMVQLAYDALRATGTLPEKYQFRAINGAYHSSGDIIELP